MMTLFRAFDAEVLPPGPVADCAAVLSYIGGALAGGVEPAAADQWNAASDGGRLRQAPIWAAELGSSPTQQGHTACDVAKELGWVPGRGIWLDMETSTDGLWVEDFIAAVKSNGYREVTYGSLSSVFLLPADAGYHVAQWNGLPIVNGARVLAHQYAANITVGTTQVDLSVVEHEARDLFGIGLRK
jgi:hypothetical protein